MPILTGDIKLLASAVMDDVPEGGGAPTANVIADGVSNAIFPDISEMDRGGGRVAMRKLHVSVQTDDRSTYLGSNIIVAEPPADPNVSITLLTTNSTFDTRAEAVSRVESYLNKGTLWAGYLYENHIAGQRSIQIFQRPETELPAIGQTLVLVQNEGLTNQFEQYIRTITVESVTRTFTDPASGKDYKAAVVTLGISDALRYDMTGSPASIYFIALSTAAKVRDTVVADAGVYVGVVPLAQTAALGDFTVNSSSVYTQLVPSAQTEAPISDVRTNGLSAVLVATGAAVTTLISMGFTTATALHVGGPIYPGSLSITRNGVEATDKGGLLISASAEVGQVDYDNGIVRLSVNVWGTTGGTHTVTFIPAVAPDLVSDQKAIRITAESRALNYAFTMARAPLPRSVTLSYLAQGRWYVLRDNGGGVLSGVSSAYGVGTVNYTTGSMSVTLGALPDVGSSIVVQSSNDLSTVGGNNSLLLSDKAYFAFNSDGIEGESRGSKSLPLRCIVVNWLLDGVVKGVRDVHGMGFLEGDGTGSIDYSAGVIRISPDQLPPSGTVFVAGNVFGLPNSLYVATVTPTYSAGSVSVAVAPTATEHYLSMSA